MPPINIPQPSADTNDTGDAKDKPKRGSFISYAFYVACTFIIVLFYWGAKQYDHGQADCQLQHKDEVTTATATLTEQLRYERAQHAADNRARDSVFKIKDSIIADKYKTIFDLVNVRKTGNTIKITK